ncbi:MAG TPA: hypothetical protein VH416_07965 [Gaiellaceae bacterium]|jgi:hypothetical protein
MAQPLQRMPPEDEELPLDPTAVNRAYRRERARRRARARHEQEASLARVRFYAVMGLLVAGSIVLLVLIWQEVAQLFGI